jgi:hypothetical protein
MIADEGIRLFRLLAPQWRRPRPGLEFGIAVGVTDFHLRTVRAGRHRFLNADEFLERERNPGRFRVYVCNRVGV